MNRDLPWVLKCSVLCFLTHGQETLGCHLLSNLPWPQFLLSMVEIIKTEN